MVGVVISPKDVSFISLRRPSFVVQAGGVPFCSRCRWWSRIVLWLGIVEIWIIFIRVVLGWLPVLANALDEFIDKVL